MHCAIIITYFGECDFEADIRFLMSLEIFYEPHNSQRASTERKIFNKPNCAIDRFAVYIYICVFSFLVFCSRALFCGWMKIAYAHTAH